MIQKRMVGGQVETEYSLRRMVLDDVDAVHRLASRCPEAAQWSREEYRRACAGEWDAWVACLDRAGLKPEPGQLAGFVIVQRMADEMEILNLAVQLDFRRRGVGTRLLEAALAAGRVAGARRAFLEVRASNAGAVAFYAKRGFRLASRRPRYYVNPVEDALVFSRPLA